MFSKVPSLKSYIWIYGGHLRALPPPFFLGTVCSGPSSISLYNTTSLIHCHLVQGWTLESSWNDHILFSRYLPLSLSNRICYGCAVACEFGNFGMVASCQCDKSGRGSQNMEREERSNLQSREGMASGALAAPSLLLELTAFLTLGLIEWLVYW